MAPRHHLAQFNIGKVRAAVEDPSMAGFTDHLDEINALAESSAGFVWRLQTEEGNATAIHAFDDPDLLVNMSVWESIDDLSAFTYRSEHREFLRRRNEWFHPHDGAPYQVLWWIPEGRMPTVDDAKERLARLEAEGPTPEAFTFRVTFDAPEA